MKLSTKGRYAMIALTDLAAQGRDRLVSLSEVAERQDISLAYLEQLFVKLRRAEIVESVRGPGGGYRLARPIEQIRISEILAAVDETMDALRRGRRRERRAARHARAGHGGQAVGAAVGQRLRLPAPDPARRRGEKPARALSGGAGLRGDGRRMSRGPRVYLDWNATAPLRPEARAAMVAAMDVVGNPSSVHAEGRAARALVERARAQVAAAFGADPAQVVFTSGATEAAALALAGRDLAAAAVEHDCVAAWTRPVLPVDARRPGDGGGPGGLDAAGGEPRDRGAAGPAGRPRAGRRGRRSRARRRSPSAGRGARRRCCRRTSSAGRRASARCCCATGADGRAAAARRRAGDRAGAPGPRTCSGSPASARRPPRRRAISPTASGSGSPNLEIF